MILSGAGSAWHDVVAEEFAQESKSGAVEVVLRPGCYLTHDVGIYKKAQTGVLAPNPVAKKMGEALLPALQLWAYVQSIPEPDRAIVGFGKQRTREGGGRRSEPAAPQYVPRETLPSAADSARSAWPGSARVIA